MTDRCEPPPEWQTELHHWLLAPAGIKVLRCWFPKEEMWAIRYGDLASSPEDLGKNGFTYLAPARPDDAAERVRMEQELALARYQRQELLMAIKRIEHCAMYLPAGVTPASALATIQSHATHTIHNATHPPQPGERDTE